MHMPRSSAWQEAGASRVLFSGALTCPIPTQLKVP